MTTLNIVGCGRAGRALGRLFATRNALVVQDMYDRLPQEAVAAAAFIGVGRPVAALEAMRPAKVWMLTPPDAQIVPAAAALAAGGRLRAGDVVFHCSGALPSRELAAAQAAGAAVAGVHPIKTFAEPSRAVGTFEGTYCAAEGDAAALAVLTPAFEALGARVIAIDPDFKTVYHAASVLVCNDLVALLEAGARCYEKAGLPRAEALQAAEPLVRETVDNVFRLGTAGALTGPVARGDAAVVAKQIAALAAFDPGIAAIYRELGRVALALARARGDADPAALDAVDDALKG